MKKLTFILPLFLATAASHTALATKTFTLPAPVEQNAKAKKYTKVYQGKEFGLIPNTDADSTPAMLRAIAELRAHPGSKLDLAKGTYHLHEKTAELHELYISNHEQPYKHMVPVPLVGLKNVTIQGNGSLFLFHGSPLPVLIMDSERVSLENIALDYQIPHHSQGKITKIEPGFYEVTIDSKAFPHTIKNGNIIFSGEGWADQDRGMGIIFDGKTHEIVRGTSDFSYGGSMTTIAPDHYRVQRDISKTPIKVGDIITYRQNLWESRPHPCVVLYRAQNTILRNVSIHSSHGMGLLAQRSENIAILGGGIYPRKATGRYFSTNADATHFSNCKGKILVENALFEGMMDDAINVHDTCLRITEKLSPTSIRCRYMHNQAYGFEIAAPKENLRFIHAKTLTDGETRTVTAVKNLNPKEVEFTFDKPIPENVNVGDAVENSDFQPSVIFRNNIVRHNRARGALFTTNSPVLVENNVFDTIAGSAILLAGDANGWFESGACHDVLIQKNKFRNNLTSRFQFTEAIISAYPEIPDLNGKKDFYHSNVRIIDNDFETFDVPILFAISVSGITFQNNRITYNNQYTAWGREAFIFKKCEKINISNNRVTNPPANSNWKKYN